MTESFRGDDLLAHLEYYGVVVCKNCQFAIQPSALPSHLLRHRIYRNERRQLLQRLSRLHLLEPEEVPLPSTNTGPLPNLSVHQGFKCQFDGCDHACVSSKRMSQHWSEQHDEHDSRNVKARSAYLQTFFRGNKIRYFEVNGAGPTPNRVSSSISRDRVDSVSHMSTSTSPPLRKHSLASISSSRTPEDGGSIPEEPNAVSLDMTTLQYFHHYIINTALTCRRSKSESEYFWKVQIPQFASRHPFLMFSIVGLSALHQSVLALDNPVLSNIHHEAAIEYQNSALIDFRSVVRLPDVENSTALIAFGRIFGVQRCVQHQIEWILSVAPTDSTDKDLSKLLEFFFLLRGEHEMLLTLQHLLPPGSDLLLTEESMSGLSNMGNRKVVTPEQLVDIPMQHVQRLTSLPTRLMPLIAEQQNPDALPEHHEPAINGLLLASALSYALPADMRNLWDGAEGWVRTLPDHYIHMLSAGQPGALVIFAHWLMLAQRLEEHYWFLKGQAIRLHTIIMNNLPTEEWKDLVRGLF